MAEVLLRILILTSLLAAYHSADNNALNDFAIKTAVKLYSPGRNFVYSPVSVAFALGMLLEVTNGTSRQEIVRSMFGESESDNLNLLLGSLPDSKSGLTFNVANYLYSQKSSPLRESFVDSLKTNYRAAGRELDFGTGEAVKIINNDVKVATKGMIPKIVENISSETTAMIVNAIYFKAKWASKFTEGSTKLWDFHLSSGEKVKVPMMYQLSRLRIMSNSGTRSRTLILPYKENSDEYDVYMIIVLPDPGQNISQFLADFDAKGFTDPLDEAGVANVRVRLPRFKLESSHKLIPTLEQLGIQQVFGPQADLTRMWDNGKLASPKTSNLNDTVLTVSDVFQKAVIEVNEEGTKAAAVTAVQTMTRHRSRSRPPRIEEFNADRPFLYALVSESSSVKNILFVGAVENPLT